VDFAYRKRTGGLLDVEQPLKHRRLIGEGAAAAGMEMDDIQESNSGGNFLDLPDEVRL
jgi:hypothetical protein